MPFADWLRGPLRGFCEERLSHARLGRRGMFAPAAAQDLWQGFLRGRGDVTWSRPWLLVVLEEWLDKNGF
jgi:asparagine synthase (glutamine-hydrolysing)